MKYDDILPLIYEDRNEKIIYVKIPTFNSEGKNNIEKFERFYLLDFLLTGLKNMNITILLLIPFDQDTPPILN